MTELGPQTESIETEPHVAILEAGTVLGGRYRVISRIADGGMATVFTADDVKHGRRVAVKVMHETLAHSIGVQRFLREIDVIARLQHPHLLTLFDSGTVDGLPYYVMPFVEAQSLRETITERGQLPLDEAITIAREMADGLAYAHAHGVVHRDIKPSNILMSGGHAIVADFGIATAVRNSSVERITVTGSSLGSPTYMSPEQAAGERDLDQRSDIYSLACVVYEMLTGQPPIDHTSMQAMVTRKLTGLYAPLRELRPDLPASLDVVLHRALSPNRAERFASMEEFSRALQAAVPVPAEFSRRARWTVAAGVVIVVGIGAAVLQHQRRVVWASQELGEITRLVRAGKIHDAFELGRRVRAIIPGDSTLRRLRPLFTDFLKVVTQPPGARVAVRRLGARDTTWIPVGSTPLDSLPLPKLFGEMGYEMRLERTGYQPVQVHANLFLDLLSGAAVDTMYLDTAGALAGMARIRGTWLTATDRDTIRVADFHIAKYEVTNREYMRFVAAGGYRGREYWTEPMVRDGKPVTWEAGVAALVDRTGQPGPSTWSGGTFPPGEEDFPVGGVSYYEAAAYARFAGMQLPTSEHWFAAVGRHNREAFWMYAPAANMNAKGPRAVGRGLPSVYGLYDVAGNVREWCVNPIGEGHLTLGGMWTDDVYHMGHLIALDDFDRSPTNGLRLAKITDPDSILSRFTGRIERSAPRDFNAVAPISAVEYDGYRRIYDYDRRPLETKLEAEGELESFRWQKVSFTAAYDGPRMAAYLLIPRHVSPPYVPIIYWTNSGAMRQRVFNPAAPILDFVAGFIPRSGRVLVLPLFMGTYERDDSTFSLTKSVPDSTMAMRNLVVQWVQDLRRTVDFLETRQDLRSDRVGFYGASWGGAMAPLALALEPRIRAAVLSSAGYLETPTRPEIFQPYFAPRVRAPVLMLNGRYDTVFPHETSQLAFFRQLGTPAADKSMHVAPNGHTVPMEDAIPLTLAWFDKYLGGATVSGQKP